MENTADLLVHITLRQLLGALVLLISYTFLILRAYFHILGKIKDVEKRMEFDNQVREEREDHLEKLLEYQKAYREEIIDDLATRYESQVKGLNDNFKQWFMDNRQEHDQFLKSLAVTTEMLNTLNTEMKQHLSYEAGKEKGKNFKRD